MARMWMVRGEGGSLYDAFRERGVAAVGWNQLAAHARPGVGRRQLIALYQSAKPQAKQGTVVSGASQVWRFVNDIQDGDWVVADPFADIESQALSNEVGTEQSLLVCCSAFHGISAAAAAARWPNLTLTKIPKMVLAEPSPPAPAAKAAKSGRKPRNAQTADLFADGEEA